MATSGSGSADSAAASGTFAVSGYTVAELELLVEQATGLNMDDAEELKRIDQAITAAGHAAATWNGHGWWWTQASLATFDTEDGVSAYNLRTVNSNAMQDIHAIQQIIFEDDYKLGKFHDKIEYDNNVTMFTNTGKPTRYAIWGDLSIGLADKIPGDTYTLTVSYLKHHSEITGAGSSDAALIVPSDFQWGVYVAGATWLLRRDTLKPASLKECPAFVEAMERMAAADPSADYDQNAGMGFPAGAHVTVFPTGSDLSDYGF